MGSEWVGTFADGATVALIAVSVGSAARMISRDHPGRKVKYIRKKKVTKRRTTKRKKTTSGYKNFNGKRYSHHSRSRTKTSANRIKKEMSKRHYVRVVKSGNKKFPYSIWIRRK